MLPESFSEFLPEVCCESRGGGGEGERGRLQVSDVGPVKTRSLRRSGDRDERRHPLCTAGGGDRREGRGDLARITPLSLS